MTSLSGRTAVVTGGESGIGRATAILLAERGARVFVGDVRLHPENRTRYAELRISSQLCDVRTEEPLRQLVDRAAQETGRLDIMVNNAGVALVKPVLEVDEFEWRQSLDTNVSGAFFGCKHAYRYMSAGGGGSIINMASNAGLLPRTHDPVYSITKHALVGLTKCLALSFAGDKVRVNAVCPGPVGETGMVQDTLDAAADETEARQRLIAASPIARAWGRMITPQEVAEAVYYLASDASLMVTGTCIAIDGGKSLGVPAPAK